MSFRDMPKELMEHTAGFLDGPSLCMMSMVNTQLHDVVPRPSYSADSIIYDAAKLGYTGLIIFVHKMGHPLSKNHMIAAVSGGHLDTVNWLHAAGCRSPGNICEYAAQYDHFDVLKLIHDMGKPLTRTTINYAAINNSVPMIEWILSKEGECYDMQSCCVFAASSGSLDVIKWLYNEFPYIANTIGLCESAATSGHLITLDWLMENNFVYDCKDIMTCAIRSCNMQLIEYVYENGGKLTEYAYREAIVNGRLDLLKWLVDRGCTPYNRSCWQAAMNNKLEILEYLGDTGKCTCTRYHSPANGHTQLVNRVKHRLANK